MPIKTVGKVLLSIYRIADKVLVWLRGDRSSTAWVALISGSFLFLFFGYLAKVFDNASLILIGSIILIVCLLFYKWHLPKTDITKTLSVGTVAQFSSIAWEAMRPGIIAFVFLGLVAFVFQSVVLIIIGGIFIVIGLRTTQRSWYEFIAPCSDCGRHETKKCDGFRIECDQARKRSIQEQAESRRAEAIRQTEQRHQAEHDQRKQRKQETLTLNYLMSVDPIHFESIVAKLFRKAGFTVTETSISGDSGIDLVLERKGNREIVQCKRWKDPVGIEEVQRLCGCLYDIQHRPIRAWLVTTSSFTVNAKNFARASAS